MHSAHSSYKFFENCAKLIMAILTLQYASEDILKKHFRENPQMGKNDREAMTEVIYNTFRNFNLFVTTHDFNDFLVEKMSPDKAIVKKLTMWLVANSKNKPKEALKEITNIPNWLSLEFEKLYQNEAINIINCYKHRAPIDIRINSFAKLTNVGFNNKMMELSEFLAEKQYQIDSLDYLQNSYRITPQNDSEQVKTENPKINLTTHPLYQEGFFEIQDYGSQLIIEAISKNLKANLIVDYCAGAGGKTIALLSKIYQLQQKSLATKLILACDTNEGKLSNLKNRLSRLKNNINTDELIQIIRLPNSQMLAKYYHRADLVIVDAPCSGLGTLRRSPELAWKISSADITYFSEQQQTILENAAKFVRKDGVLLYATCSWLQAENDMVIKKFLKNNPNFEFENLNLPDEIINKQLKFSTKDNQQNSILNLNPYTHKTDGFYMAKIKRIM